MWRLAWRHISCSPETVAPTNRPSILNAASNPNKAYRKELLQNQLWQVLNFGSKAGFLLLLTPLMISKWGADGYGLFALASSLLVSMAILDGGVRALTRIQMAEAWKNGDEAAARRVYSEGLLTFASVCVVAIGLSIALAAAGWMGEVLRLPPGGAAVMVMTVICTAVFMTTLLGLEPLAARGNLSELKAANTWGAVAAIPVCAALVFANAPVGVVVFAYAFSLTVPNVVVAWRTGLFAMAPWKGLAQFGPRVAWKTLHSGMWYYMTTVSLVGKTHALTFLVSAMAGPAEAGLFYVLLRFSEIVGNVGATASETSLAALSSATDPKERRDCFRQSWLHVALFCTHGSLVFIFLTKHLLSLWLHGEGNVPHAIGITLAAFGLTGAFSRVVVNASMGLDLTRPAAIAGAWEALLSILGAAAGYHLGGLPGLFLGGSIGILCLIPVTGMISGKCGWRSLWDWFVALRRLLPGFLAAGGILYASSLSRSPFVWFGALAACGGIALWQLRAIHSRK